MSDQLFGRGLDFARKAIALAVGGQNVGEAGDFASKTWGSRSNVAIELKSAVPGGTLGSLAPGEADLEFFGVVQSLSLLGRIPGLRRVAANIPQALFSNGATAFWIGESKAIPVSPFAFARDVLRPLKAAALIVLSRDLAEAASGRAVESIRNDLVEAAVRLIDLAFIDPSVTGSASTPAAITSGAVIHIASTGDLADDVDLALAQFSGQLSRAVWVTSPRLAAQAGLRSGGKGAAADLGARGGTLAGSPVYTSESVPLSSGGGVLTLLDPGAIAVVEDGIAVASSEHATVEQDSAPQGASDTPTASSATLVSMFSTNSLAMKLTARVNWVRARNDSVVVIDEADYAAA